MRQYAAPVGEMLVGVYVNSDGVCLPYGNTNRERKKVGIGIITER